MSRRAGRIAAVQLLYSLDTCDGLRRPEQAEQQLERHCTLLETELPAAAGEHARALCRGVVENLTELDSLLQRASANWRLERMSRVDRNILRLAAYELSRCPDVPTPVVINEAVELGKELGTSESRTFINGVLGKVVRLLGR